jgi:hypothetical protein
MKLTSLTTILVTFIPSILADAVIQSVQTSGSGCPGGNGIQATVGASNLITLSSAPNFTVALGGDAQQKTKSCRAMISVNVGPKEQFTILQSDFLGTAKLDPTVKLSVFSSFSFQSTPDKTASLVLKKLDEIANYLVVRS